MKINVHLSDRLARTVSVIFTTPGEINKKELPAWFVVLPIKYQGKKGRDASYHRLALTEKALLLPTLHEQGFTLIAVSSREKVKKSGICTQTKFTFATSGVSDIPASAMDEAMVVFEFLLNRSWESFAALSQEKHSHFFVILLG